MNPPAGAPQSAGATPPAIGTPPGGNGGSGANTALGNGSAPVANQENAPAPLCSALEVHSTATATTAELTGLNHKDGTPFRTTVDKDVRPQVVGIYTDLDRTRLGDAKLHADIDSRFSSSPSLLKRAAIAGAVLFTLVALVCLYLVDTSDGRRKRRFLPARWWRFTVADAVVMGALLLWHVIGANTSDDGYILTMARVSKHAGYTANYYRWFGVAEAPFGWPYEVLAQMTRISDASLWMRLPSMLAGLLCWLVISREVLPRLGSRVRANTGARWTAGLVFLAVWLPYNNGLRPEPLIALGALLTWCSIERAIATRRLLPAAVAVLVAAFSLAAGPSGLICVAALLAGSRPILQTFIARARTDSGRSTRMLLRYSALLGPVLAAGTLVLVVVFADQTLASVLEATRVRQLVGPDFSWIDEPTRWESLLSLTPDGSLSRRFGILGMLLCSAVCVLVARGKGGRIPSTARGPVARVLGIVFMSLLLMMFTPTKWTHHFGVYAGLAAALAAITTVAVSSTVIRARYTRSLFAAAVLFLLAVTFTGSNGWWYVSGYGVSWPDRAPLLGGMGIATLFLCLAVLCVAVAGWQYYREPYAPAATRNSSTTRFSRFTIRPLTVAAAALVLFEVASMAHAAYDQYPGYSVALSNLHTLAGHSCAMADDVLVETNTADSLLHPYTGTTADSLAADNAGFTANGLGELIPDAGPGGPPSGSGGPGGKKPGPPPGGPGGPGGNTHRVTGINGSTTELPFGLDPARTPVLGSYTTGDKQPAHLTTQWYQLDLAAAHKDSAYQVLILTVAGQIASVDDSGRAVDGQQLQVEFAHRADDGTVKPLGDLVPRVSAAPRCGGICRSHSIEFPSRPMRFAWWPGPTIPPESSGWPSPRHGSRLATLNSVVGRTDPVLADFHVGLAFPCQHPFDHKDGIAEVPGWRILPDKLNSQVSETWQDDTGGGPLGWIDLLLQPRTVPAYLDHDWTRDWGELQRYQFVSNARAPQADITVRVENRWGWTNDAPIKTN